jgi:hypothetical protein
MSAQPSARAGAARRPTRLGGWRPALTPARLFALAGLLAVLVYAASVAVLPRRYGHIVGGDGVHYYVYLRSLVHDGDLDFTNEYGQFNRAITDATKQININVRTPTGLVLNQFSIGPALLAMPLYLAVHGLTLAGRAAGLPVRADGYGLFYEGAFALTGVLAGAAGAAVAYAALRRWLAAGPALLGVAGLWLGGSLLYYTVASPVYAHTYSALGVAAWLLAWSRLAPGRPVHWLGLGVLGGLMATMRWQEALFAAMPLLLWAWDVARGRPAEAGALTPAHADRPAGGPISSRGLDDQPPARQGRDRRLLLVPVAYGLGLLLGFAPQMAAWMVLFGAPLAVPQTGYFFTWREPHWLDVLLSTRNGLFTWTPVALFGVAGLLALLRAQPRLAAVALAALLSQVLANGLVADWWGGAAFGARRFSGAAVFLALGVGWLATLLWPARRRLALGAIALLIVLNGLLMVQYSAFLRGWTTLDTYPTLRQLTVERFTWPLDLARRSRAEAASSDQPAAELRRPGTLINDGDPVRRQKG